MCDEDVFLANYEENSFVTFSIEIRIPRIVVFALAGYLHKILAILCFFGYELNCDFLFQHKNLQFLLHLPVLDK